jgi:hypothetical protein
VVHIKYNNFKNRYNDSWIVITILESLYDSFKRGTLCKTLATLWPCSVSQHILKNRYNDFLNRWTIHQIVERFTKRWQRSDHALTSQHIVRNRYNDSLNRWTIHQIVERFTKHWQCSDYSLTSQYILRNRCNDFLKRWTIYRALATFWPLLTNSLISLLFSRNVITTC